MEKYFSCAMSYSESNKYTLVLECYMIVNGEKQIVDALLKINLSLQECLVVQEEFYNK